MSKNYKMPPTVEESNDIVFLLEHHYETSGLTVLKTAANELRRLYDLLRVDPVEMPEYTPNIVIRMGVVMKLASKYFGMSAQDLVSDKRSLKYIMPRHVTMYLAKNLTNLSYPQVGAWFNRDHTTIIHGCDKIAKEIETNTRIKKYVDEITALCQKEALEEHKRIEEIKKCPTAPILIKRTQPKTNPTSILP